MGFNKVTIKDINAKVFEKKDNDFIVGGGTAVENKKIKNSQKVFMHGIWFDSKLELYMYDRLRDANIPFTFKPKYIIGDAFKYRDDSILAITLTPDFDLPQHDIIIDAKGYSNDLFPLKLKLLKKYLIENGRQPRIILPSSQLACRKIIYQIVNGFYLDEFDPKQRLSNNQIKVRIKEMKKYRAFDGKTFYSTPDMESYSLELIKKLEKFDFNELIRKLNSERL